MEIHIILIWVEKLDSEKGYYEVSYVFNLISILFMRTAL